MALGVGFSGRGRDGMRDDSASVRAAVPHYGLRRRNASAEDLIHELLDADARSIPLNESAMLVCRLIDGVRSVGDIVDLVSSAYPQNAREVRRDIPRLLLDLTEIGLVELAPAASTDVCCGPGDSIGVLLWSQRESTFDMIAPLCRRGRLDLWVLEGFSKNAPGMQDVSTVRTPPCLRRLFAAGTLQAAVVDDPSQFDPLRRIAGEVGLILLHEHAGVRTEGFYSVISEDRASLDCVPNGYRLAANHGDGLRTLDGDAFYAFVGRAAVQTRRQYRPHPFEVGAFTSHGDRPWDRIRFFHPGAARPAIYCEDHAFVGGAQTSTLQAGVMLQRAGFDCELVDRVDGPGIYLVHPDFYDADALAAPGVFVVSIDNDRPAIPSARCRIVQNPCAADPAAGCPAFFVPYYPQRGLTPRSHAERGDQFENVVYFGRIENLAREFIEKGFERWMSRNGMRFIIETRPQAWSDYAGFDAVLAVRDFENSWSSKPANKLINAWRAEVPAVLGPESAFQWYRRGPLDYIEVRSLESARSALLRLRRDRDLVAKIRQNARVRQADVTFEAVTRAWAETLESRVRPLARRWFLRPSNSRTTR